MDRRHRRREVPSYPDVLQKQSTWPSNWRPFIKLKTGYIPGLGDTADFAIIWAGHGVRDENELGLGKL